MAFDTNRIESDGLSTIESRLNEILQRWFCGSQSEMARQLGVTQAAISLAVTGKRKLGPRLLTAVKGLPGLPVDWLIGGKGTLPERPVSRDPARCFLPLYRLLRRFSDRRGTAPVERGPPCVCCGLRRFANRLGVVVRTGVG